MVDTTPYATLFNALRVRLGVVEDGQGVPVAWLNKSHKVTNSLAAWIEQTVELDPAVANDFGSGPFRRTV